MQRYDFRISDEAVNQITERIDKLSDQDLLELSGVVEKIEQTKESKRITKAKEYFDKAIAPGLIEFAKLSGSVLTIEDHDKKMSMQAIFKNELGFDITDGCRLMRFRLILSNHIGIMTEGKETTLSLVYDFKEMSNL
ncbi:MAG: hypothetical protein HFG54_14230 [Lachnospiraceae bacterium]|jgi:hypothetical protein|nr:hypothetical protein [Lachnospiraceae bacterium]